MPAACQNADAMPTAYSAALGSTRQHSAIRAASRGSWPRVVDVASYRTDEPANQTEILAPTAKEQAAVNDRGRASTSVSSRE
jgi:hypothetical protein